MIAQSDWIWAVLFLVGIGLVIGIGTFRLVFWKPRRRRFMKGAARDLGLEYRRGDPGGLALKPFPLFRSHGTSGVLHTLSGAREGGRVEVIDYWWREWDMIEFIPVRHTVDELCAVLPFEASLSPTMIYHGSGAADFVESETFGEVLTLESASFHEAFRVRTTDLRFAHALLDQRMMEWLMSHKDYHFEVAPDALLVVAPRSPLRRELEDVRSLIDAAVGFRSQVPRVVPELFPPRGESSPVS